MEAIQQRIELSGNTCIIENVPLDRINVQEANESMYANIFKSLKENADIYQPVRLLKEEDGSYSVIFGRRRILAAKKAGKETIWAVVHTGRLTEQEIALQRVIENMNRSPNPAVEAESLNSLLSAYDWSVSDAAKKLGIPASHIKRRLKLLQLIPDFFEKLKNGNIKLSVAQGLATLPKSIQKELLKEEKLTLDKVKSVVRANKLSVLPEELFELQGEQTDPVEDIKFRIKDLISKTSDGIKEKLEKALLILEG